MTKVGPTTSPVTSGEDSGEVSGEVEAMKKYLLDDVIDWFGTDLSFSDEDEEAVTARVRVNLQAMRRWAVQYSPHVRVLFPENLVETVKQDIRSAAKAYELIEST